MSNQSSFIIRRRITNMYMNNGPGMWITIQSFLIYKDIVVYAQWLGYYQSLARLRVTGSVTRVILPHLWLLIGTPLVKTLWMWIKANLDFWHLLFFWNQPRPLIYFTGPSWFKKQQPKNKTKKTKKKKKKKTSAGVVTNAWVTTYRYTILAIFVTITTTPQSILYTLLWFDF